MSARLSWWVTGVLAVTALVAMVAIVVELVSVRPRYQDQQADQEARADVVRVAEQFTAQFNSYSASDIDSYKSSMNALLSTSGQTALKKTLDQFTQLVEETKLESEGKVLSSAVASVDPDSAEVLVVADATAKSTQGTRARHFRWEVDLVKVDGEWLVDDFTPIQ